MMTHRIGVLLVVMSVPACGGGAPAKARATDAATAPVAASAPVAQTSFASTNELVSRSEVRALVDELAAAHRIAEKHVSYGGHASEEFKVYERLATIATDTEMIALLGHTSPIVRGYAAQGVIERDLAGAPLDGVLADETLGTLESEILPDGRPHDGDALPALVLGVREKSSGFDLIPADHRVVGSRADDLRAGILVQELHLKIRREFRLHRSDDGAPVNERLRVFEQEARADVERHHPARARLPRRDGQ